MKQRYYAILRTILFTLFVLVTSRVMSLPLMPPPSNDENRDTICHGLQNYQFGYEGLNLGVSRYVITSLSPSWLFDGNTYLENSQGLAKSAGNISMPIPSNVGIGTYDFSFFIVDSLYSCQGDTMYFSLVIIDTARGIDVQVACESYTWIDGNTYTASTNTPRVVYPGGSITGCDSIVTLDLTISDRYRIIRDIVACDTFLWTENNIVYRESTVDSVMYPSSMGCDSVIIMNLTLNPVTYGYDSVFITREQLAEGYVYHHETFHRDGDYEVILSGLNAYGCDSIVSLTILSGDTIYGNIDTVYICAGSTYEFNGQICSDSGLYMHHLFSVDGSDSIARMYLYVNDTLRGDLYATICVGGSTEPVEINGQIYTYSETVAGEYLYDYKFKTGDCDTIVTMHLTVLDHPTVTLTPDTSLCYGNYIRIRATSPTANSFSWSSDPIDETLDEAVNESTIVVRPLVSTTYTVVADIQPYNCKTEASTYVYVTQPLVARLHSNPREVNADNLEVFFRDISEGNIGRAWEFLSNNPTHRYHKVIDENAAAEQYFIMPCDMDTGEVTLKVWNELYEQCMDTARVRIAIDCSDDIWIPNTFTPNDAINNHFEITTDEVSHFEMYIYSRAGLLVYQVYDLKTHNDEHGWNGRRHNVYEECPKANYVYLLRYSTKKDPNTIREKAGSVLLLR